MTEEKIRRGERRGQGFYITPGGLDDAAVRRSREEHGANILTAKKRRGFFSRLWSNMGDPVIRILIAALAVDLVFTVRGGNWVECVGIAVSVILATFISTISEYGSEAAFEKLNAESAQEYCRVRRGGGIRTIKSADAVVGDIILLSPGDKIPADSLIFSGRLKVDQSAMTGESVEVEKYPSADDGLSPSSASALLRGCAVMSGEGEAVVCAVGDRTFIGEISREVQEETRESPLKIRLAKLARQISRLGYIMAAAVAAVYLVNVLVVSSNFRYELIMLKLSDWQFMAETLLHALTLGLTVIVVAVPEGLPMMIAVVLSANISKMVRDNVLVRKPVGIEAAGSMNILFTDKTGTLTEGKLSVGNIYSCDGQCYTAEKLKKRGGAVWDGFCLDAIRNSSAERCADGVSGGNSTDRAFLAAAACKGCDAVQVVRRIPFDSAAKYSSVELSDGRVLIKGAPELIIPHVGEYLLPDGSRRPADAASLSALVSRLNRDGVRTVLVAEGNCRADRAGWGRLCAVCVVTLNDRLRREAHGAVRELRGAGIHIVMLTGDSRETAEAIARGCGILGGGVDICLTGSELSALSDMRLREMLPKIGVIARVLPSDKSRLVRVAQEAGLVTGMTGDGINDAPALKRADIGFAMGNGTQVAKEAGDIIILDNNLSSICRAVLYGRNIFKSIRKFITLQLTMNLCAVGVSMIGPFIGCDAPVTVVQMLWINIIMDTLGGLAFAGEPALPSCMSERPKRRDEPILNGYMINEIVFLGIFTVGLCIAFLKLPFFASFYRASDDDICLLTAFFALFIFSSVFNCFNARTDRLRLFAGIRKNPAFIFIMSAVLTIQLVFVYLGGSVLRTTPLTLRELGVTMAASLLVFPAEFIRKLLWRFFKGRKGY